MLCRIGCGACCIAPSISSPIPGMPDGKPAGVRCIQLSDENRCKLFGRPERPEVCQLFQPSEEMCGHTSHEALIYLTRLERATSPSPASIVKAAPGVCGTNLVKERKKVLRLR